MGKQVERLEDEADRAPPEPGAAEVVERGDVDADEPVGAGRLAIEEPDDVEQRRLPGTGRADDRHPLAGPDREVDVAQGVDRGIGPEGAGDVGEQDDRLVEAAREAVAVGGCPREVDHGGGTLLIRSAFCSRNVASSSLRTFSSTSSTFLASHSTSAATVARSSPCNAVKAAWS